MSAAPAGAIFFRWRTGVSPTSSVMSSATRRELISAVFMWLECPRRLTSVRDIRQFGQREWTVEIRLKIGRIAAASVTAGQLLRHVTLAKFKRFALSEDRLHGSTVAF